ncbi:MAG: hypothetical protein WBP41_08945 [Saprospiraceae bacterium]
MGLTIFYSGKIRDIQLLPELTSEVTDICDDLHWVTGPHRHSKEIPLQGFHFHPPGCEPVWLTFRQDGLLADPVYFIFKYCNDPDITPDQEYMLCTVTQYAGIDAHMALIRLLRYLSRKYFEDFQLIDESEYWETGDAGQCIKRFKYFTQEMDEMSGKLDPLDGRVGETGETFSERIEELLRIRGWDEILDALG